MANKQDVSTALSTEEIAKRFELEKISDRTWRKYNLLLLIDCIVVYVDIQGSSGITGTGLYEGLDWLHAQLAGQAVKDYVSKPLKETKQTIIPNENE